MGGDGEAAAGSVRPSRQAKASWVACKGKRGVSALCLVLATVQLKPRSLHSSAPSTGHDTCRALALTRGGVGRWRACSVDTPSGHIHDRWVAGAEGDLPI